MTTLLVDGNNVLVRGIKAMQYSPLSSAEGVPTGALMVFINTLSAHIREQRPDRIVVCWDGGGSAHRTRIESTYKANRHLSPKPQEERDAFSLAARFLVRSGIPHIMEVGVEADDLIAYFTYHRTDRTVILSNDKDFRQLIADDVDQVRISGGGAATDLWTIMRIREEIGCEPAEIALTMAIAGDKVDNVIGVPGYGEIKALKALKANGMDLEKAIAATPRLSEHAQAIRRNLTLVDLRTPIDGLRLDQPPEWVPTAEGSMLWEPLIDFLTEYDMKVIIGRLKAGTLWSARALPRV